MPSLFDYHMHTVRCKHATGTMEQYVQAAIAAGLEEIGFSDHLPLPRGGESPYNMAREELPAYVADVLVLRPRYPQITIRLGVEADYIPGAEPAIAAMLNSQPLDYVIGSTHHLQPGAIDPVSPEPDHEWCIDNPAEIAEWAKHSPDDVWRAYLHQLEGLAATGLFQIVGHLDLPKKFGHRPTGDMTAAYESLARSFAAAGMVVELNTAGLRKPVKEIYPSLAILKVLRAAGVRITLGSDAHAPQEVGYHFTAALALARQAGYQYIHHLTAPRRFDPVRI